MAIGRLFGNATDLLGTKFKLPEFGLSEWLAGGNTTVNTGKKPNYKGQEAVISYGQGTGFPMSYPVTWKSDLSWLGQPVSNQSGSVQGASTQNSFQSLLSGIGGAGGGAGGGAAGAQPAPFRAVFQGREYTNEADLLEAQRQFYDRLYAERLAEIGTSGEEARSNVRRTAGSQRDALGTALMRALGIGLDTDFSGVTLAGLAADSDLGRTRDKTLRDIGTAFSNMGGIRQSVQGFTEDQARDQLAQSLSRYLQDVGTNRQDIDTFEADELGRIGREEEALRRQLASDYTSDRDALANSLLGRISALQEAGPGVRAQLNTANLSPIQGLLGQLEGLRSSGNFFGPRLAGSSSNNQTEAILQYLRGLA